MDVLSMVVALANQLWQGREPDRISLNVSWIARPLSVERLTLEWDAWPSVAGVWAHSKADGTPTERGWC